MAQTLGEFEHVLLLALMHHDAGATALEVRTTLEERAGRSVSRGALYATLDRLAEKGWVSWSEGEEAPARGGIPARIVDLTASGRSVVAEHHVVLRRLTEGLRLLRDES
jgi:DNA-binding PadR family transcriptional regulator